MMSPHMQALAAGVVWKLTGGKKKSQLEIPSVLELTAGAVRHCVFVQSPSERFVVVTVSKHSWKTNKSGMR